MDMEWKDGRGYVKIEESRSNLPKPCQEWRKLCVSECVFLCVCVCVCVCARERDIIRVIIPSQKMFSKSEVR